MPAICACLPQELQIKQIVQMMQVWVAGDIEQRLDSTKLTKIIEMAAGLLFDLGTNHTACLADVRRGVGPSATECC